MANPEPTYTADNCHLAYQLNWSLSLFATCEIPDQSEWLEPLREATESDGVRILEFHQAKPRVLQFFTSTKPHVAPAQVIRSVKGRLQNLIRDELPKAFRRNYRIESVGEVNNGVLQAYVAGQADRHRMAEARVQELFESLQLFDPQVDLSKVRYSAHGQFLHNLHLVLENAGHLHDVREEALQAMRNMIAGMSAKKGFLLSRAGIVSNHLHLLIGCDVSHAPLEVGLSFLNNLAYALGMKPAFEHGFYVGTFGSYDRDAIRRQLL